MPLLFLLSPIIIYCITLISNSHFLSSFNTRTRTRTHTHTHSHMGIQTQIKRSQANLSDERRWRNSRWNTSQLNSKSYQKHLSFWSSWFHLRDLGMGQHTRINKCNSSHKWPQRQKLQDCPNRHRKGPLTFRFLCQFNWKSKNYEVELVGWLRRWKCLPCKPGDLSLILEPIVNENRSRR